MATFKATFGKVSARADTGATVQIIDLATAVRLANLTTSGSSQIVQDIGGGDWTAPEDGFVVMHCDGAVDVAAGTSPTAAATAGAPVLANVPAAYAVSGGDKIAVKDA